MKSKVGGLRTRQASCPPSISRKRCQTSRAGSWTCLLMRGCRGASTRPEHLRAVCIRVWPLARSPSPQSSTLDPIFAPAFSSPHPSKPNAFKPRCPTTMLLQDGLSTQVRTIILMHFSSQAPRPPPHASSPPLFEQGLNDVLTAQHQEICRAIHARRHALSTWPSPRSFARFL